MRLDIFLHGGARLRLVIVAVLFSACSADNIPASEQFKATPVGTPYSQGSALSSLQVPSEASGVLFTNQSNSPITVAINNSIIDIPVAESFLFILSPGTQQFYIYEFNEKPKAYTETTQAGKIRYVYFRNKGGL
jgi:hypothetical protein